MTKWALALSALYHVPLRLNWQPDSPSRLSRASISALDPEESSAALQLADATNSDKTNALNLNRIADLAAPLGDCSGTTCARRHHISEIRHSFPCRTNVTAPACPFARTTTASTNSPNSAYRLKPTVESAISLSCAGVIARKLRSNLLRIPGVVHFHAPPRSATRSASTKVFQVDSGLVRRGSASALTTTSRPSAAVSAWRITSRSVALHVKTRMPSISRGIALFAVSCSNKCRISKAHAVNKPAGSCLRVKTPTCPGEPSSGKKSNAPRSRACDGDNASS